MSRPGPNNPREPRPYDWQRQFEQPDLGAPYREQPGPRQPRGQRPPGPPQPPYQPRHRQPPQPAQQPPTQQLPYPPGQQQPYRPYPDEEYEPYQEEPYRQPPPRPPSRRAGPDYEPRDAGGRGFRLPGLGLILSLLGFVVQILCMLVLPWVSSAAANGESISLPKLWDLATKLDAGGFTQGFGAWYVVLLSYPLAALGVLLALVSVLEFVAGKVIFGGLAIIGIGWLLLRYGVGPAAGLFGDKDGFSRPEVITTISAVGGLVLVIFMLKAGLAMFRRIAGVVLIIVAGVHIYAVRDLTVGGDGLAIGAYGPALGYLLSGAAALIGPRRLIPG